MKKCSTLLLLLMMIFTVEGLIAQTREKPQRRQLYQNGVYKPFEVLDTRVDNMKYWNKAAELGLTPYNPVIDVPKGTFKSSYIDAKSVVLNDSPDVPVTTENSTQSENSIFVDPNDPDHVLQSNNSTQNPVGSLYGANYFFSSDFGLTWGGSVQGAGGSNSGDPATAIGLNGRQYVGFIHNNYGQGVSYSDNGITWTSVQAGTSPGGGGMLDKNHLWIDNSPTSLYQGNVYDAWTAFGNSNDSEIEFVRSINNGLTYSAHKNVSQAVNAGSHCQGVNITTGPNGEVYVIFAIYDGWPTDETAIGMARSLDGGATFTSATRIIGNIKGIRNTGVSKNQRVNSFPSATCDLSNGNIYVTWTNCGIPGINTGADRDIYMIRSEDQGITWSAPIRVNQDPIGMGKKHYFPWISCDPETGALSTIFYDDRNVGGTQCEVFCANSFDGGDTWEDFKVSDVAFTPTPIPGLAGSYMGDYLGISARGGKVYPVWCDNRSGVVMSYTSPYEANSLPRPTDLIGNVTFETGEVQLSWTFTTVPDFQYFVIYRDNFQIATSTNPFYTDNLPDYGNYKYLVTAMHLAGESSGTSASVKWGDPHITVDPVQIIENIAFNNTSTRFINVTNVGQLDLIYSITSSTEPTKGRDYCTASTSTQDEYISNVVVAEISKSSGWQGGVANYTDNIAFMEVGTSHNITVSNGNAWASDIVKVWVDWNDDFTFGVGTDEEYQLTNVGGSGQTFTGVINVPMGTPSGEHRMRIRMTYSTAPVPCGSATYGEIEDYTVSVSGWMFVDRVTDTIAPGTSATIAVDFDSQDLTNGVYYGNLKVESNDPLVPSIDIPVQLTVSDICYSPNNLLSANITTTSAELLWNPGGQESKWDIIYGFAGFSPETSGILVPGVIEPTYLLSDLTSATSYDFYVRSDCGTIGLSEWAGPSAFTTLAFEIVWTSPFQPMSIFVTKATIDNLNMVAGDEIGVFDIDPDNGNEICVGSGMLTGELTGGAFIEIVASMDDGTGATNGFQPGNEMIFKLYSPGSGLVDYLTVTFPYPGYDETFTPLGTSFVEVEGITTIEQTIPMTTGWNLVSFRAYPENMNMLTIFDPIIVANQLTKVLDQDGNSIIHLPFPPPNGQWANTIGDLTLEQGYYVKVTENTSITIEGIPVAMPFEIPLRTGWNMISVPCSDTQSAEQTLQTLISSGKLIKVTNDAGQSIVHLPFPPPNGQWSYGFTSFVPNEGYYLKVNADCALVFDCSVSDGAGLNEPSQPRQLDYFQPVYQNNPFMPMTVALSVDPEIEDGDEIGIFDGETCVGASKSGSLIYVTIPVSMDDPETEAIDGFVQGNPITARIWHHNTNVAESADLNFLEGSSTFQPLETYIGSIKTILTSINEAQTSDGVTFEINPNPVHGKATMKYSVPSDGPVNIQLLSIDGRLIETLVNETKQAGEGMIEYNSEGFKAGSYLVKFSYKGSSAETIIRKLFIY